MSILFALLSTVIGAVLLFGGYRLARILIPLWGFISGLSLGGAIMSDLASTPFLGSVAGILVGLVAGLAFAVLAYLYYSAAVIVAGGMLGYWIGSSFIVLLGLDPGFLSTTIGLMLGLLAGIGALLVNAPKYVLIILTSFAGAVTTVSGFMILFNAASLNDFNYQAVSSAISNSFIWSISTVILAAIGTAAQARLTADYTLEKWAYSGHSHSDRPSSAPHISPM